jgi:hypothetical protein
MLLKKSQLFNFTTKNKNSGYSCPNASPEASPKDSFWRESFWRESFPNGLCHPGGQAGVGSL